MDIGSTFRLRSGRETPVLGLGTWQLTKDTPATVELALALGYRMIDTSGDYGTQPGIGRGLKRSDLGRDRIFLVTKVEENEDAYEATADNLSELGVEYADLMLIHRPPNRGAGVELWEGLLRAQKDGLTNDVGVSNYSIEQIEELIEATGELPAVNQIEWSPFGWSREMLDYCRRNEIVIQAYSPLTRIERLDDEKVSEIAQSHGKTPAQTVIRWNLQLGVAPLPKANRPDHLEENLDVFDFELTDGEMRELGELNEGWSSLGGSLQYV